MIINPITVKLGKHEWEHIVRLCKSSASKLDPQRSKARPALEHYVAVIEKAIGDKPATLKKGQTVYYNAQGSALRPVRARVERATLQNGKIKVRALWCVDPLTGEDTGTILGYDYEMSPGDVRATLEVSHG